MGGDINNVNGDPDSMFDQWAVNANGELGGNQTCPDVG